MAQQTNGTVQWLQRAISIARLNTADREAGQGILSECQAMISASSRLSA